MWIKGNYRRIFLDMHIDDWNDGFLSKLDPEDIVSTIADAGARNIVVKAKPHTGLCYWPSSIGRMHRGLAGKDYVGEMIRLCHNRGIDVIVYYSQVFDNWAYDNHPDWRCEYADGLTSREKHHYFFRKGRYGVVCANNQEYREYVKANLQELCRNYRFEGMFLDMPFWPEVCYCESCRERYRKETSNDMPCVVDWEDPEWLHFQYRREMWMGEFAAFSTGCIKGIDPEITVEHNFAVAMFPWQFANSDLVMDACDYAGGDYYGGYLQQTFACKYYRNVSPHLPFSYITSRCDPDLHQHTTTKTKDEFLQHAITALVHNGAFSICDGMDPDGTICHEAYEIIRDVFQVTSKFERFVSGDMLSNAAVWFPTHAKYDLTDQGKPVSDATVSSLNIDSFSESQIRISAILRENNIPFDVVASRNLKTLEDDVLIISDVMNISDSEMDDIENYVLNGGNLYVSGHIGHPRLSSMMNLKYIGTTSHEYTYMKPTAAGSTLFEGFNDNGPLTVVGKQVMTETTGDCEILATMTLPYSKPDSAMFSSIHSDPPGIDTEIPSAVITDFGKGRILWLAAPIEKSKPFMSRRVVGNIIRYLCAELKFQSNAPSTVEIVGWIKEGKYYFAAINQQETTPITPVYDIFIDIPGKIDGAGLADTDTVLRIDINGERSRIYLPRLDVFCVICVWRQGYTRTY